MRLNYFTFGNIFKFVYMHITSKLVDFYSRGARFETRPMQRLFCLRFVVSSLSRYLNVGVLAHSMLQGLPSTADSY